ncbi:HU-CCDC81 and SPOR domain-containing protein [Streptomyces sp. LaPpAH-108]|uniref:pPIWI_RE_Y domain-containing protein n=1 Tax=Streptomyces sp. LaPpAH-108 TaxID=1155714 RepID=UPI000379867B|nr:HU-CCDC81 and SPOR domain-containing protein [Streptomyces sp. LaPpAH-108]
MDQNHANRATSWPDSEGIRLLRSVATAMVRLGEATGTQSLSRPYPEEAQSALNRTVLACLLLQAEPPTSLPDLVAWAAQRPLDRWPLTVPADAIRPGALLLDEVTHQPTQLCYEWAVDAEESTALSEQPFMSSASTRCREEEYPEAYRAFRRLLIRHPVLTHRALVTLPAADDRDLGPVGELLHEIYQPAPAAFLDRRRRVYTACGRCHALLHPTTTDRLWCERRTCQNQDSVRPGREYRADEDGGIHLLIRPLRQWVSAPGILEERLARKLEKVGADVELWPDYGAYGMRVRMPGGRTLAVEHKDWTNPALLGRRAFPPLSGPPYDRCVWVVPAARLREQPTFRMTFERYRPTRMPELMSDKDLVESVRKAVGPNRTVVSLSHATLTKTEPSSSEATETELTEGLF